MRDFFQEFKKFIARGSVIDLAVGIIIGGAFQKIVTSLVNDIIFPALAPVLNLANFADWKVGNVNVGNFIQNIVDFIIVAFFIFLLVKFINRFRRKEEQKPPAPTNEERLLTEIRDILKNK